MEKKLTGWIFTDAKNTETCVRCSATPGQDCKRPSGRAAWPPHSERVRRFIENNPDVGAI